jgi:hypothetical protein
MYRHCLIVLLLAGCAGAQSTTEDPPTCRFLKGTTYLEQKINGSRLVLKQIPEPDKTAGELGCRAKLMDRTGKQVWQAAYWAYSVPFKPVDVNNDGSEDFILEGYSGGAHCCWQYTILSTKGLPLMQFDNNRSADFEANWRGKHIIFTLEGGFDYFEASHAASFFPPVYLLLDGQKLYDISGEPEFREEYDKLIQEARQELAKSDRVGKFKQRKIEYWDESIRIAILQIVECYLYSYRPVEAWKALDELWPAYDRRRVKKEILKIRKNGVLKHATKFHN